MQNGTAGSNRDTENPFKHRLRNIGWAGLPVTTEIKWRIQAQAVRYAGRFGTSGLQAFVR